MTIPLQLIVLSIPSLLYIAVRRWRKEEWREIFRKIGWRGSQPSYFLWGVGVALIVAALGWLAFRTIPAEVMQDPNINVSAYSGLTLSVGTFLMVLVREAITVALGEEVFFRGLLGGWLTRRLGFAVGNAVQAVIFLLPHLFLLLVSVTLWPILIAQLVAGWLLGWLRYRSDSILPGWVAHSLTNALGAVAAMR